MSFEVMRVFEDAGFKLKELIIKEQHNCQLMGYWKTNSVKYIFWLIAHEYLFVFRSKIQTNPTQKVLQKAFCDLSSSNKRNPVP